MMIAIDTVAHLITALIYMLLAVLTWWAGQKLRRRFQGDMIRFWIRFVAAAVAITFLIIGLYAFYEAITAKKIIQPIETQWLEI